VCKVYELFNVFINILFHSRFLFHHRSCTVSLIKQPGFWTLSTILILIQNDILETGLCLHPQIKKLLCSFITQISVFTSSMLLFIHFSLLHILAVNYQPSSGNSYIYSTYSAILSLLIGQCSLLGEGRIILYTIGCWFFRLGMHIFKCVKH
jgi:hypothetical protein